MSTRNMQLGNLFLLFLTFTLQLTLGSSEDLSALGERMVVNQDEINYNNISLYNLKQDHSIILRETILTTYNNVYVAFVTKTCYSAAENKNVLNCRFLRTYASYDQLRDNPCENRLSEICDEIDISKCFKLQNMTNKGYIHNRGPDEFDCTTCNSCWKYTHINAKCRLPTMRIVNGYIICELESERGHNKPLVAKIDLKTGRIIIKRTLNLATYVSTGACLKIQYGDYLKICYGTINDIYVHIMVDNANIWLLYNGDKNGILERINMVTLSSISNIQIESVYETITTHAFVVSNKFYMLSISGNQLSIIKAIDTNNPRNTMSTKVTILNEFKHDKYSWMHYNPRLGQLFINNRKNEKRITEIYPVERCAYAYPKSIDFDELPVKSTFLWSLYPNELEYYKNIIQIINGFLRIKNPKILKKISVILLACPYRKCNSSSMMSYLKCRLKDIRSLFESFAVYKNTDISTQLQVHFDMVKLLEQRQFRQLASKLGGLWDLINQNFIEIKKEIHDLRSTLGTYFTVFANFDSKKSAADLNLFYSIYNDLNNKQNKIASTITRKLRTLFKQATESSFAEIVGQMANVAISCAAFVKPFNFFDSTDQILQLQDRLADYMRALVNSVKLKKIMVNYFPRLRKIGDSLKPKIRAMSSTFPNIKKLLNKAMNKRIKSNELAKYVDVFLKEYGSYQPAFEPSTIDEYEAVLGAVVNELCRIIYAGKSLSAATAQGVLASKGSCLATKIDVQTLMGLYRDMYEKQGILMEAFASAVRATAARLNAERIRDITNQINTGHFLQSEINYKLSVLEILLNSLIHTLLITREACILIKYKNGGAMPKYCIDVIDNGGIGSSDQVISSRLNRDMCDGVNIQKYVYIPAQQQGVNSRIPDGTVDLTRLYRGYEVIFQIPNKDWLIKHKWIYGDDKDKMIVLKEFDLFIPANSTSEIYVKSTGRYISQNMIQPGGKIYELNAPRLYQYNFQYSQGGFQCTHPMLPSTPYELPQCPKLPRICVESEGKLSHQSIYPSIYSKFGIKLSTIGKIQEPKPTTKFFLMATVTLCIVENAAAKRKRSKKEDIIVREPEVVKTSLNRRKRVDVCCGKSNMYYDPLNADQTCKPCPRKSTAKFGGLYCE